VESQALMVLLLVNNAIILLAPYISGVFLMNGGDLPTHGGMVLDIFEEGSIDFESNFYPIAHILAFAVCAGVGTDYITSFRDLGPFFSLLLPVFIALLARVCGGNTRVTTIAFVLACGFYFSSLFQLNSITTPNGLSLLLLPFLIYVTVRSDASRTFRIALMVIMVVYVFFHPITSVLLMLWFGVYFLVKRMTKVNRRLPGPMFFSCAFVSYLIFLTAVWKPRISNAGQFFRGYRPPPGYAVDIGEGISKLGLDTVDTVLLFLRMFGHQSVLLLLSAVFILALMRRANAESSRMLAMLISLFAAGALVLAVQLLVPTLINISFFRPLSYVMLATPIFTAFLFGAMSQRIRNLVFVVAVSILLFGASVLVVFPSPYIMQANSQVTYEDLEGARWILEKRNESIGMSGYFGNGITIRLVSALIPYSEFYRERYQIWVDDKNLMIDHLGYMEYSTVAEYLGEQRYIVITSYDLITYEGVYSNIGRLVWEDLAQADLDTTLSKIYSSSGYDIFLVHD